MVHGSNSDVSAPVFDATVQLVLMASPYNVWRLKKPKISSHDNLFFRDMKNTIELIAYFLRPGGYGICFCTAQQSAVWHTLFCAYKSTQSDGLSLSSASTLSDTCMVSAASLTFKDHPSHHRNNPAKKFCALAKSFKFALHVEKMDFRLPSKRMW